MVRRPVAARAALAMLVEARNMVGGMYESCRLRAARTSPSPGIYFVAERRPPIDASAAREGHRNCAYAPHLHFRAARAIAGRSVPYPSPCVELHARASTTQPHRLTESSPPWPCAPSSTACRRPYVKEPTASRVEAPPTRPARNKREASSRRPRSARRKPNYFGGLGRGNGGEHD